AAWIAAQELRLLYRLRDPQRAAQAFTRWLSFCADSEVPELHRLARTLDSWREELLARFTAGPASNGPTEAINLLIKKIKRVGHAPAGRPHSVGHDRPRQRRRPPGRPRAAPRAARRRTPVLLLPEPDPRTASGCRRR